MSSRVVKRPRKLRGEKILSPPVLVEPLYQCAVSVTVESFEPQVTIQVDVSGTITSVQGGYPYPQGVTIQLPAPLVAGQIVRARQRIGGLTSPWTATVTVQDHTQDYPAGPPRPAIDPAPVYACGVRTGVSNLLPGGHVWITADGATVGDVKGCSEHQGVNVSPAYSLDQNVQAWFELCLDPSPPSAVSTAGNAPNPPPALSVDPIYAGGQSVTVKNVVNGARVTLYRGGVNQGTWPCWGYSLTINGLAAFSEGEEFTATQQMCPGDPDSPPATGTVLPCSSLPAPQIGPVQAGDTKVTLTQFVPDAVISVYVNGTLAGASGGPVINLNRTLVKGDTLVIVQDLAGCQSQYALEVQVPCVDPPVLGNPASLNLFPVGWSEYKEGAVKGSVYYPAEADGKDEPFYDRLAKLGRVPIVFMAHGNHDPADPSYLGYDYFQRDLAKMGMIAVSVDCNALNGAGGGVANIVDRADLIIDSIAHFRGLDGTADTPFEGKIDFSRVGLMGHSRGGDAVVTVPTVIALQGVTIRSALALAPTNFRYWFGLTTIAPQNYAFMTILPAGDGDVRDNNGAQFYDQAQPGPFKSQLYVHYTNHNFFNRQWLYDDSLNYSQPAVISRYQHERMLSTYGCALFRATLLGHPTDAYLSGDRLPSGTATAHVYRSFERTGLLTVDNHEDGNTIHTNSLGQPTTQTAGMVADEFPFDQVSGAFNSSFYGLTTGMVAEPGRTGALFRSQLSTALNMTRREVWIRAAEVTDGSSVPAGRTGFELGLEDAIGNRAWIDSDDVGGLPRPYERNAGMIKTMLSTLRFRGGCFTGKEFDPQHVVAILIRANRKNLRPLAFDDLQVTAARRVLWPPIRPRPFRLPSVRTGSSRKSSKSESSERRSGRASPETSRRRSRK